MSLSPLAYMSANYSRDLLVSLATVEDDAPWVRTVNAFYEDGAFYIITHESSRKLRQIACNPKACICGDWFTLHGLAADMGRITAPENAQILSRLRVVDGVKSANVTIESEPGAFEYLVESAENVDVRRPIFNTLAQIVADAYKTDISEITPDTPFEGKFKASSVVFVGIVAMIENEFDVFMSIADASKHKTVGRLAAAIEKLM